MIAAVDAIAREAMLFAGICFLVGGVDDLLVDCIFLCRRFYLAVTKSHDPYASPLHEIVDGRFAVVVAAWDEAPVIGQMLRTALSRFDYPDYRIYVGAYPNDPATVQAVRDVVQADARVRLVVGDHPGPTTKADCLNSIWTALCADETAERVPFSAVVLHDAEDIVHPLELRVFARHLRKHAAIQLPVVPLRHPKSLFISGHYCDEFAEASCAFPQLGAGGLPLPSRLCASSQKWKLIASSRTAPSCRQMTLSARSALPNRYTSLSDASACHSSRNCWRSPRPRLQR